MNITFNYDIEFEDKKYSVEFQAEFCHGGIGSYEFWGQKCYDRGGLELDNLTFTPTENDALNKYIDSIIDQNAGPEWDAISEKAYEIAGERDTGY